MLMIGRKRINNAAAAFTIALALIFWYIIFGLQLFNFWYAMAVAALTLATLGIIWGGKPFAKNEITLTNIAIGVASAAVLYFIFWCGNFLAGFIFGFAPAQIQNVYGLSSQAQPWVVALLLLFVTSPAEEIFWRGFLQRWVEQYVGPAYGWILGALIYAGVHILSGNFMLVMAALVAGLFWGLMYAWRQSVVPVIICHSLWTAVIFVFFPVA